jgi:FkbM family methyltransferase
MRAEVRIGGFRRFLVRVYNAFSFRFKVLSEKAEYGEEWRDIVEYRDCFETVRALNAFIRPKYLCDIGGNDGHWSLTMQRMNPDLEHVVFFEPQSEQCERLRALSLGNVEKVVYECGLGSEEGRQSIMGGTASASFLEASSAQSDYFPESLNEESEVVEIKLLDDVYTEESLPTPDVIKIDVQGFELNVLKGARDLLRRTKFLVVELSYREFYKGQPPMSEVLHFLERNSFVMIARGFELVSPENPLELLQVDGIFVNTALVKDFAPLIQASEGSS